MVKKLCVTFLMVFLSNFANAQDVNFGVKIGMNISSVNGKDLENLDSRTGIVIGGFAEIPLLEKFSLQPELLYSAQGAKQGDLIEYDLNYVLLPLMAKYYISKGFNVEAGPQFSFLVKDSLETIGQNDENTNAENFDLAANFGLGYKFDSGFFFQARYNLGLIAISKEPDFRNGVFQMALGLQF